MDFEDESPWSTSPPLQPTLTLQDDIEPVWNEPNFDPYAPTASISDEPNDPEIEQEIEPEISLKKQEPTTKKKKRQGKPISTTLVNDPLQKLTTVSLNDTQQNSPPPSNEIPETIIPRPEIPNFTLTVGDPQTVGEMQNAHTVYTITSGGDLFGSTNVVQRRYRDFRWLQKQLKQSNPGILIPPAPEKQAIGRFNVDFVEFRRLSLEQMLRKIALNSNLNTNKQFLAFLQSTDLQLEQEPPKSFLTNLISMKVKPNDSDVWAIQQKQKVDEIEILLRDLLNDLNAVSQQRHQLSQSLKEYANIINALADVEFTPKLSKTLVRFGKVHTRLAAISERLRIQTVMNLELSLDEYFRLMSSIKEVINYKQKLNMEAEELSMELEKKQLSLKKINTNQQDRLKGLEQDIEEVANEAKKMHESAASIGKLVESEIVRVKEEKVVEFRNAVELYLEGNIEAHKETIEVWEGFYQSLSRT